MTNASFVGAAVAPRHFRRIVAGTLTANLFSAMIETSLSRSGTDTFNSRTPDAEASSRVSWRFPVTGLPSTRALTFVTASPDGVRSEKRIVTSGEETSELSAGEAISTTGG